MQRNVTQNLQKLYVTVLFHTEQSLDEQLHFSEGELLVPAYIEQDIQDLCALMLHVL